MIETGLVYIRSAGPTRSFKGCGTLVEGGYVATCRHVWRMATEAAAKSQPDGQLEVEIEYPYSREGGSKVRRPAWLADECGGEDPAPDLVLLLPKDMPSGVMTLQLATTERFEAGEGYAQAGLRRDKSKSG